MIAPETLAFLRDKAERHTAQRREELATLDEIEVLGEWVENMRANAGIDKVIRNMLMFRRTAAGTTQGFGGLVTRAIVQAVAQYLEDEVQKLKEAS